MPLRLLREACGEQVETDVAQDSFRGMVQCFARWCGSADFHATAIAFAIASFQTARVKRYEIPRSRTKPAKVVKNSSPK